jgi:hypothetical protein
MQNNIEVSSAQNEQMVRCELSNGNYPISQMTKVVKATTERNYEHSPVYAYVQTSQLYNFVKGINTKGEVVYFWNDNIANRLRFVQGRDGGEFYQTLDRTNTASYHNLSRMMKLDVLKKEKDARLHFKVGLEIEKEDYFAKASVKFESLHNKHKWCKEEDASLCRLTGYELVSPVFSLYGTSWKKDFKNKSIARLIDGSYSQRCGGHINLSSEKYTSKELYQGLSGFFPLFYSLYENRIHHDFCKAKKVNEMGTYTEKRSAFYMKDDTILEFRIFPAVKNTMNLSWRLELLKIMVENINCSEMDVLRMMVNKKSKLYKHLLVVIDDNRIKEKVSKFIRYSKDFNDKNLDNPMDRK